MKQLNVTLILNFFPYLITNNISVIFDGIILNSQDINPASILKIIYTQAKNFFNLEIIFLVRFLPITALADVYL